MKIELKNVSKVYMPNKNDAVTALNEVNLTINQGDYLSICGVSGSGKSTLLHLLGCLDIASCGEVLFDDKCINRLSDSAKAELRNSKIGFVFQDYALIPYRTVYENLMVPLYFSSIKRSKCRDKVEEVLEYVSMEGYENRKISTLSGGQKQRIAIARALICNPEIILADEPSGALDSDNRKVIIELFKKINDMGKTLVVVTHDNELALASKRRIVISDGRISENN